MGNKMVKVSVIIPVYNGAKYISEAIDSVLKQTFKDFEIIVIDDGSKDNSLDILLEYQTKDKRLLIVNQSNIGLTRSLNRGAKLAASEYVARQDADDHHHHRQLNQREALSFLTHYISSCCGIASRTGTSSPQRGPQTLARAAVNAPRDSTGEAPPPSAPRQSRARQQNISTERR